jgi:ABC-2 type transport system ATP-binding protein
VPTIEVEDLHKRYGDIHAVRGVSFTVAEGEVVALLGPNGAGKSSTVEVLEGHRSPTSGRVSVLGMDPAVGGRELRDRIGIVLQSSGIEDELTVREALDVYGACYRRRQPTDEVIELVGLADKADARIPTLSGGQRRRIDLALGLIGSPEVLFLDEPTTGFDPAARRGAWELIAGLRGSGTTILLTTHYLEEAQLLADRVAVIDRGVIVAEGAPAELTGANGESLVTFTVSSDPPSIAGLVRVGDARYELRTTTPTADLARLTTWAVGHGEELGGLTVSRPTLEDVYLALVAEGGNE